MVMMEGVALRSGVIISVKSRKLRRLTRRLSMKKEGCTSSVETMGTILIDVLMLSVE